jgi:hypothetical protein
VGHAELENPQPQRDKENDLTRGMTEAVQSSFLVRHARELKPIGDFESLVIDRVSKRTLLASFVEDRRRNGYVLAFVPGEGFAAERRLEPALAAVLVRMALQAAGSGDPYVVRKLAEIEQQRDAPMPADWPAKTSGEKFDGLGMLDENASALKLGRATAPQAVFSNLPPTAQGEKIDLAPWLIAAGLVLCGLELWAQRPRATAPLPRPLS